MKDGLRSITEALDQILDEGLMDEELLYEFATVRARDGGKDTPSLIMAVSPSLGRIGEPYFKVYNAVQFEKATKVARISFLEPRAIRHRSDKHPWMEFSAGEKKEIVRFLGLYATSQNATVWDTLKYYWNDERGIRVGLISDYLSGASDEKYKDDPCYVPSTLKMPDYMQL